MKRTLTAVLTLAAVASATPLMAQGRTCSWDRSTNSVGDIIFGRNVRDRDRDCDVRRGLDNAWYQRGRDGTYERRHLDANGNWVVERATRDANGNMVITSTRPFGNERDDSKAWKNQRKADKRALKEHQKAEKRALKARTDLDHDAMKGAREDLKAHQRAEKRQDQVAGRAAKRQDKVAGRAEKRRDDDEGRAEKRRDDGNSGGKGKGKH